MSDVSGAAAESTPAPELPLDTPNPISTEAEGHSAPDAKPEGKPEKVEEKPEVKSEPQKSSKTPREALEKASKQVEKDTKASETKSVEAKPDKEAKPVDRPELKTEPKRDETGKFASEKPKVEAKPEPKPSHTAGEPPARFTQDVKQVWATLPDNVRGEVSRMERELTQGYQKHKESAEAFESYRELDDIAKQSGKRGSDVFREYYQMEQYLQKDLVGGLDNICQRMGVSLRDVAAHILNQTPDQVASKQDATIRELRDQIGQLQQQVGSVSQNFQKQQETVIGKEVEAFAAAHPRFEELHQDIAFFLKTRTKDLSEAYQLAERLNPAPETASKPAASSAAPDLSAQTEKGQKSINGSPSPGSSPAARPPSTSIKESLKRAMAQAS